MNINKLENPKRIAELQPAATLHKIGVDENAVFLDYGAGTGIFSIPAAKMTNKMVYAYDISRSMLNIIKEKAEKEGIANITLLDKNQIEDNMDSINADNILLGAVYHHIDDKEQLFSHFEHLLKPMGKVTLIEFHYRETPMGPGIGHRVHRQTVIDDFTQRGYKIAEEFEMGENFYLISFLK